MTLLIIYLLIALAFSFLCSILEAVILSVTPLHITVKLEEEKGYAKRLKKFKDNIDKPLAAILTLNTFAHTAGAVGVGAQAQILWGEKYLTLTSVVLTLLILFLSEIIPKTIGANYWRQLTPAAVHIINILLIVLYPFIILSQVITKYLNKGEKRSVLNLSEFSALVEAGEKEGVIKKIESKIIKNIANYHLVKTEDIMTPRMVMFAAEQNKTIKSFYELKPDILYSRIPVYNGHIDNITGYVLKDEILEEIIKGNTNKKIKSLTREIPIVSSKLPIPELYRILMDNNEHIALAVDEYGGTEGIVTMEDVIETILGTEIIDEMDTLEDLQKAAREKWKQRARRRGIDLE